MSSGMGWGGQLRALLPHPSLFIEAVRAWLAMSAGTRPGTEYLRWRAITAYGAAGPVSGGDLVEFLRWRRGMRALRAS